MRRVRGFSLIEVMIVVVILGILMAMGLPVMNEYLINVRLRNAASQLLTSLEGAKGAAASRNVQVEVIQTNTTDPASVAVAVGDATASGWMVRSLDRSGNPLVFLEGKSLLEGGKGSNVVFDAGEGAAARNLKVARAAGVVMTGTVTGVIFTPLGGATQAATFTFTNPAAGACATVATPAVGLRCLNVTVSTTGRIKMCDPAVNVAAVPPDARACN